MNNKLVIKITKSTSPNHWYRDKIGNIYTVEESQLEEDDYMFVTDEVYYINKSDCEVLDKSLFQSREDQIREEIIKMENSKPYSNYSSHIIKYINLLKELINILEEKIKYGNK
jgi:hypothetical protein